MARPEFKPTPAQRRQVSVLAAAKMSEERIAAVIGISRVTLRKHFAEELTGGKAKRNAAVLQAIYKQALSGNVSAMRLWVKVSGLDMPDLLEQPEQTEDDAPLGKKDQAQRDALNAGKGSEWGDDLAFGGRRLN